MAEGEKRFAQVGQLKEGNYVLIDGIPCQIKSVEKSKPGKHGAAKARIVAVGVFNGQKKNLLKSTGMENEVPIIEKGNGQVVAIMGDNVQIIDTADYKTLDVKKPKELALKSGDDIEYQYWGDEIQIVRKK